MYMKFEQGKRQASIGIAREKSIGRIRQKLGIMVVTRLDNDGHSIIRDLCTPMIKFSLRHTPSQH